MINKKFVIPFIVSACLLIASVCMLCYSVSVTNRQTDIGYDLHTYAVTKAYVCNDDTRIIGTQAGEVFAFDEEGMLQWNVGKPHERAVYDIVEKDGLVYVAFADGAIIRFSAADAKDYSQSADTSDPQGFLPYITEFNSGYSFHSSGNVNNTQVIVTDNADEILLRGMFNDVSRTNRIYRLRANGANVLEYQTSATLGGMVYGADDTLWWIAKNAVWCKKSGQNAVQYIETDETLLALSLRDTDLYTIGENKNLIRISTEDAYDSDIYSVKFDFDTGYIFSTGQNFVAKIANGGVVMLDTLTRKTAFSMTASANASLIMWADNGFALRDGSDITDPQVLYYSVDLARSIELFSDLIWIFVALMAVFLISSLYLGFAMSDELRAGINGKIKVFFRAVWDYKFIYLSLAVPLLLLVIFYYIPIVFGFGLSFFDYVPGVKAVFVGFDNFAAVVRSLAFWDAAGTMLVFLIADLIKSIVPPIILAEAIFAVKQKRFSLCVRILLFLPGVLPGVATVLVWGQGVFGPTANSLINGFIGLFVPGFVKNWVYSLSNATAIGTLIAFGFPWVGQYLIFYGAVSGINSSVFEASKLDGCGWLRRIVKIDLPLILPQIKYVFVISFIASVQNYTSIYILHGVNGQIQTPALLMYREIINANYGVASAIGVFIFLFLSVATFFNFRMQSDKS